MVLNADTKPAASPTVIRVGILPALVDAKDVNPAFDPNINTF